MDMNAESYGIVLSGCNILPGTVESEHLIVCVLTNRFLHVCFGKSIHPFLRAVIGLMVYVWV